MAPQKHTILISDDEPQNIETLFNVMSENYKIIVAPNGEIAYKLAIENLPDAIISDWDMPVLNGIESIKKIRNNPATKHIPILLVTGKMTTIKNLKTAFAAGANDFIRKPFDDIEVITRVKAMIEYHESLKKNIELEKKLARIEIEKLNKELGFATMKLIQTEKDRNNLHRKLLQIKKYTDERGKKMINRLISDMKLSEILSNWEEFELIFKKVHPDFYKKLTTHYPNLTKNDKKICVFLKLNMSNKDISAITAQSEEALKKARYRLKQKLNLKNDIKLADFIQTL